MGLIKIKKDIQKVKSILKMSQSTFDMIQTIDYDKYPSNVIKEYYEVIRELGACMLLLKGLRARGEGAHLEVIEYIEKSKIISAKEIVIIKDLREKRNKIAYDGFFVSPEYVRRKKPQIIEIRNKLEQEINTLLK